MEIPDNFINDATLKCSQCGTGIMCFTSEGSTVYCPNCGVRNSDFENWEEEND